MVEIFFGIWGWFALIGAVIGFFWGLFTLSGGFFARLLGGSVIAVLGAVGASLMSLGITLVLTMLTLLARIAGV